MLAHGTTVETVVTASGVVVATLDVVDGATVVVTVVASVGIAVVVVGCGVVSSAVAMQALIE